MSMTGSFGKKVGKIIIIPLDIALIYAGFLMAFFILLVGGEKIKR